jgi:hypothetical protein
MHQNDAVSADLQAWMAGEAPTEECILSPSGRLLAGSVARYDTLEAYRQHFGPPTSSLPGLGYWTFPHPLGWPHFGLLVRTRPRDRCSVSSVACAHQRDHGACP